MKSRRLGAIANTALELLNRKLSPNLPRLLDEALTLLCSDFHTIIKRCFIDAPLVDATSLPGISFSVR